MADSAWWKTHCGQHKTRSSTLAVNLYLMGHFILFYLKSLFMVFEDEGLSHNNLSVLNWRQSTAEFDWTLNLWRQHQQKMQEAFPPPF